MHRGPWCVSIYLPTFRIGSDALQNPIRLKNLLRTAEEELVDRGLATAEARKHLAPARHLLDDGGFWKEVSEGCAIFLAEGFQRFSRLPIVFQELAVVCNRFHIKPLLPLISCEDRFFILAVSENVVRLLEGSRWRTRRIELAHLPKNLVEALNYDQPEIIHHCHSGQPGSGGQMGLVFHGQGGAADAAKGELLEYFRRIDDALQQYLAAERAPLIFAGVDFLFPIYQQANGYRYLQEQHISGNTDAWSEAELHDRAWALVEPVFQQTRDAALARYGQVAGGPLGPDEVASVLRACSQGAVDTLLVDPTQQQWGTFDAERGQVHLDPVQQSRNEDLIDLGVALTLSHRGSVIPVAPDYLPSGSAVAALLRYPLSQTSSSGCRGDAMPVSSS